MTQQIAAIFGAGPKVGRSVALRFLSGGYRVAVVSRSGAQSLDEEVATQNGKLRQYKADFSRAEETARVCKAIEDDFSSPISVFFYNAYGGTGAGPDILQPSLDTMRRTLEVNTLSVYALARQAVAGFEKLPQQVHKAFIYTGNGLDDSRTFPRTPPSLLSLSIGKTATAQLIDAAAQIFGPKGFRFYYIDERVGDGTPAYNGVTGPLHAEMAWTLAQEEAQSHWRVTFIEGRGRI